MIPKLWDSSASGGVKSVTPRPKQKRASDEARYMIPKLWDSSGLRPGFLCLQPLPAFDPVTKKHRNTETKPADKLPDSGLFTTIAPV